MESILELMDRLLAEALEVAFQSKLSEFLVLNSDVMKVAVGTVVNRQVQTQLVLPPVPHALQRGVPRKLVEEPVEAKMSVDAAWDVIGVSGPVQFLDGLLQPELLGTPQRGGRELGSIGLYEDSDRCDLRDVASTDFHNE